MQTGCGAESGLEHQNTKYETVPVLEKDRIEI